MSPVSHLGKGQQIKNSCCDQPEAAPYPVLELKRKRHSVFRKETKIPESSLQCDDPISINNKS